MVFIGLIILTMCIFIKLKIFGTSVEDNIDSGLWGFALGFVISLIVVGSINQNYSTPGKSTERLAENIIFRA